MADPDEQIHVNSTEARAGSTPGMTRYILAFGLALIIIAFLAVFMIG